MQRGGPPYVTGFYTFSQKGGRAGGPVWGTVTLLFGVQTSAQTARRACCAFRPESVKRVWK